MFGRIGSRDDLMMLAFEKVNRKYSIFIKKKIFFELFQYLSPSRVLFVKSQKSFRVEKYFFSLESISEKQLPSISGIWTYYNVIKSTLGPCAL